MDDLKSLGSHVLALRRRLATDTLTPEDRERMNLARQLRDLRRDGKTIEECAELLGVRREMLGQFMRRGVFRVFSDYLATLEHGNDEEAVERVVRKAKHDFAGFAPDAIAYYRTCFKRDEAGNFTDDAKAMWATDKVSKGLGLTEPEHAVRPVININIASIRAEQAMASADDAEAEAAARTISLVPQKAIG